MNRYELSYTSGSRTGRRPGRRVCFAEVVRGIVAALMFLWLASCQSARPNLEGVSSDAISFSLPTQTKIDYTTAETIEVESKAIKDEYILGPGDLLDLKVWNREEVSDPDLLVGPDGVISVARIGNIEVSGHTRDEAAAKISAALSKFYKNPEVDLVIREYTNNKAFVLGRITNPGVVNFSGKGTLLEALSLAGGLPVLKENAVLTKCAIIRGNDLVIWVDLRELLHNGNMALNARIKNNDVIFIPESQDELLYVMGEVNNPGAFQLSPQMTYLDAVMMAGGPTKEANLKKTYILRFNGQTKGIKEIDLEAMLREGLLQNNVQLQDNDVIFVAEKGISKFNYALNQVLPFLRVLSLSTSNLEQFGAMQEIRNELWGQEGYVGVTGNSN